MLRLPNPACYVAGSCMPFCGMCDGLDRVIVDESLFGACRMTGQCLQDCGNCWKIAAELMELSRRRGGRPRKKRADISDRQPYTPRNIVTHETFCWNSKTMELMCQPGFRLCDAT